MTRDDYYANLKLAQSDLYHHGIKGQKWGKKNGPPYPLDEGKHSSAEKKAKENNKRQHHGLNLTEKQKTSLKVGAIAGLTAVAVIGGVYIAKNPELVGQLAKVGHKSLTKDLGTVIKMSNGDVYCPPHISDTLKDINKLNLSDNCKETSVGYCEKYLHGGDITSGPKSFAGNLTEFIENNFDNVSNDTVKYVSGDSTNIQARLEKQLLKNYSNGDCGILAFDFKSKYVPRSRVESGHAFNWTIDHGNVYFTCSQKEFTDATNFFEIIDPTKQLEYVKYNGLIPKKDALHNMIYKR